MRDEKRSLSCNKSVNISAVSHGNKIERRISDNSFSNESKRFLILQSVRSSRYIPLKPGRETLNLVIYSNFMLSLILNAFIFDRFTKKPRKGRTQLEFQIG